MPSGARSCPATGTAGRLFVESSLVNVGWSYGGRAGMRATDDDRRAVVRLLDIAAHEGRIDGVDQARRSDAVRSVRTRGELAVLASDLPVHRGVRDWADELRVRAADRELAVRWLAEAAAGERLTTAECESRVAALADVGTYAQLKHLLVGVPGLGVEPADGTAPRLSADDRERWVARLGRAVGEGRLDLSEYETRVIAVYRAETIADVWPLVADVIDPARPARRTPLSRLFDRFLLNSALVPPARHWWSHAWPVTLWKLLVVGTPAVWVGLAAAVPSDRLVVLCLGWIPLAAMPLLATAGVRRGRPAIAARERVIAARIQAVLRARHGDMRQAVVERIGRDVSISYHVPVKGEDGYRDWPLHDHRVVLTVGEEDALALLWRSRLNPIDLVVFPRRTVEFTGELRARLRRTHGPRPYGRLPYGDDGDLLDG